MIKRGISKIPRFSIKFFYNKPLKDSEYPIMPHYPVPDNIEKPEYFLKKGKCDYRSTYEGKSTPFNEDQIKKMKEVGQITKKALNNAIKAVREKVTTDYIDKVVHDTIISEGAFPTPIYYQGFPKSVCTSVNEVICHGIPNIRPLEKGDYLNIDVCAMKDGFYADCSGMAWVEPLHDDLKKLIQVTKQARDAAIQICGPGVKFSEIGNVIETIAKENGYTVNQEFIGHGIGKDLHLPPPVVHFKSNSQEIMIPHTAFTIEPILMMNPHYKLGMWKDGWTLVDLENGPSAQWEHTILITPEGFEVLT